MAFTLLADGRIHDAIDGSDDELVERITVAKLEFRCGALRYDQAKFRKRTSLYF